MAKFVNIIIGAAEVTAGVLLVVFGGPSFVALGWTLVAAGAGQTIGGIGTLLSLPQGGLATAARNPTQPWNVVYGRAKVGGTVVYLNEFGETDKYLDIIFVLACHPCESVDALLFDNQRVLINPSTGSSYSPSNATQTISTIARTSGLVTVVMSAGLGDLQDGDRVQIANVTGQVSNDKSLNGQFYVTVINSTTFTYLCGGFDVSLSGTGTVETMLPDYRSKVYFEYLLGDQTSTFNGMLNGTPYDGDTGTIITPEGAGVANPWTEQHLLSGRTCAFLRLHYNDEVFAAGLPQISFRVHGRNDVYDPRSGTILGRPSVYLNGWGNNAHVGAYEEGVDLGYNWGLNDDVTYPYSNPGNAGDGDLNTSASCLFRHTHKYAGCIWKFGSVSGANYLNVFSSVPTIVGANRSAGIWYSFDGGSTWTEIYNQTSRSKQWDHVSIPSGQDTTQIQVMAFLDSHDDMSHYVFDINLATTAAGSPFGYSENAALCIADYLANQTYGYKATYGTEIPLDRLITAANICDEGVTLANGLTEPRYTCNGQFQLTTKRGEVLQNLLTCCSGRITYVGGQFVIFPAAWPGLSLVLGGKPVQDATLKFVTSHVLSSAGHNGTVEIGDLAPWQTVSNVDSYQITDNTAWTSRMDTINLFIGGVAQPGTPANLSQVVASVRTQGTSFTGGVWSPPEQVLVYDCYIDVTYSDGSSDTLRPRSWGDAIQPWTAASVILNPQNALDSDPSTYAEIDITQYAIFGQFSHVLQLTDFLPASTSGAPDFSAADNATALALMPGPFRWKEKLAIRDLYNGVKGTYVSPANGWLSSDFPPYAQDALHGYSNGPAEYNYDANLAADGGDRRWLEIQLPFTISTSTAQRLAKIELLRRRQQGMGTFVFATSLYQCTALDVIALNLPLLGWTAKLLEISAHRLTMNKQSANGNEVTLLGCELDLQETDPSVYEWSPTEELTAQGTQYPTLPSATGPSNTGVLSDLFTVNGT